MDNFASKGVLFDLDGVLVDTEGIYTEFWHNIGNEVYPTGIPDFANVIKGSTLPTILSTYFPDPKISEDIVNRLKVHEQTMPYRLVPGVREFLNSLMERGIPAAIVTSSGEMKMNHLFDAIPDFRAFFHTVLTDRDVVKSKPDPEGYLKAAAAINRPINDCYVFEDSYSGVKAGMASGATTIALATTTPLEKLQNMDDAVIDGFSGFTFDNMLALIK